MTLRHSPRINFFILGAPKCGTTAMVDWLAQSEDVFFPRIKEPHYFCSDFDQYRRIRTLNELEHLYDGAAASICGDASVWNLYSQEAVSRIAEYNPEARVLIMLRRPVEMLPSLHNQLRFSGREDIESFEEAWTACAERKQGLRHPKHVLEPSHLYYDEICRYGTQLNRVHSCFPKEHIRVVFFEDLKENPQAVARDIFSHLDVLPPRALNITTVNPARQHRFPRVSAFLRYPPYPFSIIKRALKGVPAVRRTVPLRGVYEALSMPTKVVPLSHALKGEIEMHYKDEIRLLGRLVDRDMSAWHMSV